MNGRIKSKKLFVLLPLLFIWAFDGNAQDHVAVSSEETKIYVDPNTGSPLYITAKEGDKFKTIAFHEGWVQIYLFTGDERYIKRSDVEIVAKIPPYPADPAVRSEICNSINIGDITSEASNKAMSKYPDDVKQQGIYEQLLVDKFILDTYRKFDIPASHFSKLMECVQDDIRGPLIKQ